jgi:hypothetical protein
MKNAHDFKKLFTVEKYEEIKAGEPIDNQDFEIKICDNILSNEDIDRVYTLMSEKEHSFIQQHTGQKIWSSILSDDILVKIGKAANSFSPAELNLDEIEYSVVRYSMKNGFTPQLFPHYDNRDSQRVTFNIKLGENFKWGIVVENKTYHLNPGQAIIFSGTQQQHWREKIEVKEDDYVDMIFCFFKYKEDLPHKPNYHEIMQRRTSFLQAITESKDPHIMEQFNINKEMIQEARLKREAVVLKDVSLALPPWKSFIDHLYSSLRETENLSGFTNSVGQVIFYDSGTLNCGNAQNSKIPSSFDFNSMCEKLSDMEGGCSTLINFCQENITGKHSDPMDRFYWQCIGSTVWKVGLDNEDISYELNPGDVLFLPKNLFHAVHNLTELRAGIIFSCKEEEKND